MRTHFLFLFVCLTCSVSAQRPFITSIIQQVNRDSLILTARQLSGDTSFVINGITDTIKNRFSLTPDHEKAAQLIIHKLESFGLQPIEQSFPNSGKNIYAIQTGSVFPEKCYMICAHYDNLPNAPVNYGADDNASGVASILESARILSQYTLPFTVYYILFDKEEQSPVSSGLEGSEYFCNLHDIGSQPVLGAINMDMIAYDGNNDSVANIHIRSVGGDQLISNQFISVNNLYNLSLHLNVINPPSTQSDHASFWKYFMPAVLFIEDDKNDFNPAWHSLNDRVDSFNLGYFQQMATLATATLADLASDSGDVGLSEVSSRFNDIILYPNPADKNRFTLNHVHGKSVHVSIINVNGSVILQEDKIPENSQVIIDLPPNLPPGLWYVQLLTEEYRVTKRFVRY